MQIGGAAAGSTRRLRSRLFHCVHRPRRRPARLFEGRRARGMARAGRTCHERNAWRRGHVRGGEMKLPPIILFGIVAASAAACNSAGRAGPAGTSNDARGAAFAPVDAAPRAEPARTASPAASERATAAPLASRCPQQFGDARYGKCRWSTGTYRYCGGASPPDGVDQPREGCVCNECFQDRDCDARRAGRCLEFPDEKNCGPAAKACVYPGDPCAAPSSCKAPDRCMHDELGHAACSPPPVPHM